jgi:DNA polymerase
VGPRLLVCLGATAAQAILGCGIRVSRQRGEIFAHELAPWVLATVHPSSLLHQRDDREAAFRRFVADLRVVAERLELEQGRG